MKIQDGIKKVKIPKLKLGTLDWSKINLRKFNWITVLALLCYMPVLVLIPLLAGRKSSFVQYHVRQGVLLHFVWLLFIFSFYISILPWILAFYLIITIIVGIVNVVTGHERPIPIIGKIAVQS